MGVVDERLNNESDVDEITSVKLEAPLSVLPLDMHNASHSLIS